MRKRNWRLVIFGVLLIGLAVGFFFVMQSMALQSLDPVELMKTAGQVTGVVTGTSLMLIIIGLIGKKA